MSHWINCDDFYESKNVTNFVSSATQIGPGIPEEELLYAFQESTGVGCYIINWSGLGEQPSIKYALSKSKVQMDNAKTHMRLVPSCEYLTSKGYYTETGESGKMFAKQELEWKTYKYNQWSGDGTNLNDNQQTSGETKINDLFPIQFNMYHRKFAINHDDSTATYHTGSVFKTYTDASLSIYDKWEKGKIKTTVPGFEYHNHGLIHTDFDPSTLNNSGGSSKFTIKLMGPPTKDVKIPLTNNNTDRGTLSSESLTFTSSNWDTTQDVIVTASANTSDDDINIGIGIDNATTVMPHDKNYNNRYGNITKYLTILSGSAPPPSAPPSAPPPASNSTSANADIENKNKIIIQQPHDDSEYWTMKDNNEYYIGHHIKHIGESPAHYALDKVDLARLPDLNPRHLWKIDYIQSGGYWLIYRFHEGDIVRLQWNPQFKWNCKHMHNHGEWERLNIIDRSGNNVSRLESGWTYKIKNNYATKNTILDTSIIH